MESRGIVVFPKWKETTMTATDPIETGEAQAALDTVEKMRGAGLRRAIPTRWYGIGIPAIVAVGFGLYAQEDPGKGAASDWTDR